MELRQINSTFSLKTNFLEYGSFCLMIRNFLKYNENPEERIFSQEIPFWIYC